MNRSGRNVRNTSKGERAVVSKFTRNTGILVAAAAFAGIGSTLHAEDLLYDWKAVNQATTPVAGYIPAPFVTTGNSAAAVPVLTQSQASFPGKVAVKIVGTTPLSPADNVALFNNPAFTVNYAFMDYEGATGNATATAQATAIHAQPKGAGTFVGNFRMFPGSGDTSGPTAGPSVATYLSSGMNMANEDLYPGSPFYKNPGQVAGGTSSSPNIRTALFVLPLERASYVTANLPAGHKHIPYVDRFNNFGNPALQNSGVQFVPGATPNTANQMLSRGDFSALVAHTRLRGADGYHLLDGGVVGYTQAQFEQDAKDGFTFAPIANIFNGGGAHVATLDTVSNIGNGPQDNETTGVIYSGVYSLTQAGGLGKLALLVSNMDQSQHTLTIDNKIGGKVVPGSIPIDAGTHKLLEFTGAGTQWSLANSTLVFQSTDADRNGVGVPEPVAMGGASIFALTMLFRRRRSR
jgi:hypothetical protein